MQELKVNGVPIPFPDLPFKWTLNDISSEDSGRDMDGLMDKDEVAKKVTIDCTWSNRSSAETSQLLNVVKPNTFVDLEYPDPMAADYITKNFYTGDVTSEMNFSTAGMTWTTKLTFIER